MQPEYVKERLEALQSIDEKLCALLQEAQQVVFTFAELKHGNTQLRPQFQQHVSKYYENLDQSTSALRNEIQLLEGNVGVRLLPISIGKKNLGQDDEKLREQVELLRNTMNNNTEP